MAPVAFDTKKFEELEPIVDINNPPPPLTGEFEEGDTFSDDEGSWTFENGTWYNNNVAGENYMTEMVIENKSTSNINFNEAVSCLSRGDGNVDIDLIGGQFEETMLYDFPEGLQNIGNGLALGGYALTLTGVGAEIGVPMAAIGNGVSTAGTAIEAGREYFRGNKSEAYQDLAWEVGGVVVGRYINSKLPIKINNKINVGNAIINQGAALKYNLIRDNSNRISADYYNRIHNNIQNR